MVEYRTMIDDENTGREWSAPMTLTKAVRLYRKGKADAVVVAYRSNEKDDYGNPLYEECYILDGFRNENYWGVGTTDFYPVVNPESH